MISLTTFYSMRNENGERIRERLGRIHVDQYRSRTMSSTELIQSAFSYLSVEKSAKIITRAIPREEAEADVLVQSLIEYEQSQDVKVILFCTARNTEYTDKLKEKLSNLTSVVEITPVVTNPELKAKLYMNLITLDMYVVTNMMTDQLWFAIGAQYVEDANLRDVWMTGDGNTINEYYESKIQKGLNEQNKKEIEEFTQFYKAGINKGDPRIEELKTIKEQYDEVLVQENRLLELMSRLEREIIYTAYTNDEDKVNEMKRVVTKMYEKGTLKSIKVGTYETTLCIETPLVYINTEDFLAIKNSNRSNWYTELSEPQKKMFTDIFETGELKLMMSNLIKINTANTAISVDMNYRGECYPNPHHYHYNCWGDYRTRILTAIREYDWENLLVYLTVATAGINILDTAVINKMVRDLTDIYVDRPMLITKDGSRISPKEYIKEVLIYG